jgi:diadenosine tetraphosphate (Ap4A) HIT family hydrolase
VTGTCNLCRETGGDVLWSDDLCRVVLVDDARYPGYCRVINQAHVPEMTDLSAEQRRRLMDVTFGVEAAVRSTVRPDKVNLASLGNMTPHLHWHVIPRWRDDPHFPQSIWSAPERPDPAPRAFDKAALRAEILKLLTGLGGRPGA